VKTIGRAVLYPLSHALLLSGCAYAPPESVSFEFRSRAETQSEAGVRVTAVVLSGEESDRAFATRLASRNIQPIWLEIENQKDETLLLMLLDIDDAYFGPSEAAWRSRRLCERGTLQKMRYFHEQHIPLIIPAERTVSGFVYTNLDPGAKAFAVHLIGERDSHVFHFVQSLPGFRADFLKTRPADVYAPDEIRDLDLDGLRAYLEAFPPCVLGGDRKTPGDPLNLVIVGEGPQVLATFVRRGWDLTETITAGTAWRTTRSAAFGSLYRTAPVSSLYVFDRPQDVALQKVRDTVHERNHLRLWRAPVSLAGTPVWVGQVSRDIDVKFSRRTVVTHRIDPAVDEARTYVLLDFMASGYLARAGFAAGVGPASLESPRYNYTLDPYVTDGLRVVLVLAGVPVAYNEIEWLDWERPPLRTDPEKVSG
jgi:hypothetical protein